MPGVSQENPLLNPDYRDILSAFIEENVEFLLVGAYALAVHGLPRATGDIDLWIERSRENGERVLRALTHFGAPVSEADLQDLLTEEMIFQIGVIPRRIDLLTSIDGVEFEEAWRERVEVDVDALRVPVISRRHLIQNKRASGRRQDQADVEWLEGDPE
jgi:hypothetical protein